MSRRGAGLSVECRAVRRSAAVHSVEHCDDSGNNLLQLGRTATRTRELVRDQRLQGGLAGLQGPNAYGGDCGSLTA